MKKAIFYTLIFVAVQWVAMCVVQGLSLLLSGTAAAVAATTELVVALAVSNVAVLMVFLWRRWTLLSPGWLLTRPWSVLLWTAVASIGTAIPSVWLQEHLPTLPNVVEAEMREVLSHYWGYAVVGLLAPLAEEMVFRGGVLRALLGRMRPWTAIAVSALLFCLVHANPAQMPHAFVAGLLLGWMYWRTGSVVPGIVFHWVNNSLAYIVSRVYSYSDDVTLADIFGGERNALLAAGFSLLILLPALWQLHLLMRRADDSGSH